MSSTQETPISKLSQIDDDPNSFVKSWDVKQWSVDLLNAMFDKNPQTEDDWGNLNPMPTILMAVNVTKDSIRFRVDGMPNFELQVERFSPNHGQASLLFTGNGQDERVW